MTFNWVISQLDSIPSLDGMDKVISVIHWRAQKTHSETIYNPDTFESVTKDVFTADMYGSISVSHWRAHKAYLSSQISDGTPQISDGTPLLTDDTYGALSVDAPHEASFTPYDEVTKEMVEGWLTEKLDVVAIEANLDAQIENFLNPPLVAYALPWLPPTISQEIIASEDPIV